MAITSITQTRFLQATIVTVVSDLSPAPIFYHWYVDGALVASTQSPTYTFFLDVADQVRIDVNDTLDPDYDPIANAPAGYPARRTIYWVRSIDADVVSYRVEQKKGGGSFAEIASVPDKAAQWSYSAITPRLDNGGTYTWQVVPVDAAGNDGTALALGSEIVWRIPDAPDFTITFDNATQRVTFAAA